MIKLIFLALSVLAFNVQAQSIPSFSSAKKTLYKKIHNNQGETFYCGCQWQNKKVDLAACGLDGYFDENETTRSLRTEAEHIIPASWMLKVDDVYRACAVEAKRLGKNKRRYCRKHDDDYKKAHNDLVNLVPAVGQINADRSNKPYVTRVESLKDAYLHCTAVNGRSGFVPPDHVKGDIARIAFYMDAQYGVQYSDDQQALFEHWAEIDPVSDDEIKHHNKINDVQGYGLNF